MWQQFVETEIASFVSQVLCVVIFLQCLNSELKTVIFTDLYKKCEVESIEVEGFNFSHGEKLTLFDFCLVYSNLID